LFFGNFTLGRIQISVMIGNGVDLKTVQEICGHKDISTTMGYAHLLGDNLKAVAKTFSVKPKGLEIQRAELRVVR
jgi:integrase